MRYTKFFLVFILLIICFSTKIDTKKLNAGINDTNISFISESSKTASILLSSENKVYVWGELGENKLKLCEPTNMINDIVLDEEDKIVNVFSGEQHFFILTEFGRVFGMGNNENNQLMLNDIKFTNKFIEITSLFNLQINEKIVKISCGSCFNVALTNKNNLFTFGENDLKQLGIKDDEITQFGTHNITNRFELEEYDYIKDIKCGASHTLILTNNGNVFSFGSNEFGQLGYETIELCNGTPKKIESLTNISKISCGRYTSYALTINGELYGWGNNSYSQLVTKNIETTTGNNKTLPFLISNESLGLATDELVSDIYSKYDYAIIKTNKESLYGFGNNNTGQLASNDINASLKKINIEENILASDSIKNISCGENHVLLSTTRGHIFSWGSNLNNQISGDSKIGDNYRPISEITNMFPPIISISMPSGNVYSNINASIEAYYLSLEPIKSIFYCFSKSNTIIPLTDWKQYTLESTICKNNEEGTFYLWVKVIDESNKEYVECSKKIVIDLSAPTIKAIDENNNDVNNMFTNKLVSISVEDANFNKLFYKVNNKTYESNSMNIAFKDDGFYSLYATDVAGNVSATIEFTIDTILPKITKINEDLINITTTSYQTRTGKITINCNESLSCYKLGYKGVFSNTLSAIDNNESSFDIKLKKGVNTLIVYDLAGNQSDTIEIIYSPTFFNDTQLLLYVFSTILAIFVIIIIITYAIKSKKKLVVITPDIKNNDLTNKKE